MLSSADIDAARRRVAGAIYLSPCPFSQRLSDRAGCYVYLKLENLQMTGSFKERGACNKLRSLDDEQRRRGIVAASAGNHAQGVAYHARQLGIDALIVMPEETPLVKVAATRAHGVRTELCGSGYDEAYVEATRLGEREGRAFVHPFDDLEVMAGQGTIGVELLEQAPNLEAVVIPVGGGGLAAGVAVALKHARPDIKVYGVEPQQMPSMKAAVDAGHPVEVPEAKTIADGIAVRRVGQHTCEVAMRYLDGLVTVGEEEVAEAILVLLEQEKTVAEGAGAAALAAVLNGRLPLQGQSVCALVSGGNIDVNLMSRVIDRGLAKSGRLMRVRAEVPDVPGALAKLLNGVAEQHANVLEIHHDRVSQRELGRVVVEMLLETRGFEHVEAIEQAARSEGFLLRRVHAD